MMVMLKMGMVSRLLRRRRQYRMTDNGEDTAQIERYVCISDLIKDLMTSRTWLVLFLRLLKDKAIR